ncbi:MAG: alkaline phosphatase family protein [Acidimicrobiales bacterium]
MRERLTPARRLAVAATAALAVSSAACGATTTTGSPASGSTHRKTPAASSAPTTSPPVGSEGVPAFSHVFVVVMENLGYRAALAVPSIAALALRAEYSTSWYAVGHPSLPNYLALVSGSTWGVQSDCTSCDQRGANLASQLSAAGISWGAYFEGMPGPCFLGTQSPDGSYAEKHDPFAYFADVRSTPALCSHLQPLSDLLPLLGGPPSSVPRFVWVTPDMCHSGHDCGPSTAGAWLTGFVGRVTASGAWRQGGALFVTWDEGDDNAGLDAATGTTGSGGGGGTVLTLVMTPGAPPGRPLRGPYDHYSLLRTVEDAFGLDRLGEAAAPGVSALGAFFDQSTATRR